MYLMLICKHSIFLKIISLFVAIQRNINKNRIVLKLMLAGFCNLFEGASFNKKRSYN